jgi:hypothetical protein
MAGAVRFIKALGGWIVAARREVDEAFSLPAYSLALRYRIIAAHRK